MAYFGKFMNFVGFSTFRQFPPIQYHLILISNRVDVRFSIFDVQLTQCSGPQSHHYICISALKFPYYSRLGKLIKKKLATKVNYVEFIDRW